MYNMYSACNWLYLPQISELVMSNWRLHISYTFFDLCLFLVFGYISILRHCLLAVVIHPPETSIWPLMGLLKRPEVFPKRTFGDS